MSAVSKTWVFTLNNYTSQHEAIIQAWDCTLIAYGREVGESGTPHLQGCVTFRRAYRLAALKKMLSAAHWEPSKTVDPLNYCIKDGDFFIRDERKQKGGKSNALKDLIAYIEEGHTVNEAWRAHPEAMVKHYRGIEMLVQRTKPKIASGSFPAESFSMAPLVFANDFNQMKVAVIVGEPGIGKTQYALAHFSAPLLVTHIDDLKEFNSEIHDGIVFDDMDFKHLPRSTQIYLTDCAVPRTIHCRFANAVIPAGTHKIFTTNDHATCFNIEDGAIRRRCNVYRVGGNKMWREPVAQPMQVDDILGEIEGFAYDEAQMDALFN